MKRYPDGGGIMSPGPGARTQLLACAVISLIAVCSAGPVGPILNVTSADLGLKEGSCAVGDVMYLPGQEFQGVDPCERCRCAAASGAGVGAAAIECSRQRCEPRPGCKALHRPDHCCPTYQCECEQDGRVYGNGEKLVDPQDPCRVCYCQGGEVVCRRIACFLRDDCRPRVVPGRCCPEYDNCPLRGVTTEPSLISSVSSNEELGTSVVPSTPKDNTKPKFTIKEITPVSEIPVINDVKVILPSPAIEVPEYPSSKSPLIPREATSEENTNKEDDSKIDVPMVIEITPTTQSAPVSLMTPVSIKIPNNNVEDVKKVDTLPSKISFSTQDAINSEIYPSNNPIVAIVLPSSVTPVKITSTTSKPFIEEEDPSIFDHNPAFPPLPDDLSVQSSHDDEIVSEQTDSVHLPSGQDSGINVATSTEAQPSKKPLTMKEVPDSTSTITLKVATIPVTLSSPNKESSMLNLRSAIPTEILNVPSLVPEEITGELDEINEPTTTYLDVTTTAQPGVKIEESFVTKLESPGNKIAPTTVLRTTTLQSPSTTSNQQELQEKTTSSIAKSNVATEVTSQTELSSLPIETSDQNPQETLDNIKDNSSLASTSNPVSKNASTTEKIIKEKSISHTVTSNITENKAFENFETTEFVLTPIVSSETATDTIELIKISPDMQEKGALIKPADKHKNVLTELINLVGDVASIGDQTEEPNTMNPESSSTGIADSEELIPVNMGYKSKNNNWNFNSITEIPQKSKNQGPPNKQKAVEIEDEDSSVITDNPAPNDKVEPTTRRPIIDNVSDDQPSKSEPEQKDIEIITKSYVPTMNKRPTKVIMQKNDDIPVSENNPTESAPSSEFVTEYNSSSSETTFRSELFSTESAETSTNAQPSTNDATH